MFSLRKHPCGYPLKPSILKGFINFRCCKLLIKINLGMDKIQKKRIYDFVKFIYTIIVPTKIFLKKEGYLKVYQYIIYFLEKSALKKGI